MKHILSVIHYTICGALCLQFTHFPCDDWEDVYVFSYYRHQIRSMNYHPLLRVRSWNYGMCCMSLYSNGGSQYGCRIFFHLEHTNLSCKEITVEMGRTTMYTPVRHNLQPGFFNLTIHKQGYSEVVTRPKNFRGKLKQHHVAWRKQQDWPVLRKAVHRMFSLIHVSCNRIRLIWSHQQ